MPKKTLRQEHAEATRSELLKAARALFVSPGYAETSVEDLANKARVTTGAVYHHFKGKRDIMEALFEEIEQELAAKAEVAAGSKSDPRESVQAAIVTFLESCLDPLVRRVAFEQAPGVLGWTKWKEIDERYAHGLIQQALSGLKEAGLIKPFDMEMLGSILLAAIVEAGMRTAVAEQPKDAQREAERIFDALFSGLASP